MQIKSLELIYTVKDFKILSTDGGFHLYQLFKASLHELKGILSNSLLIQCRWYPPGYAYPFDSINIHMTKISLLMNDLEISDVVEQHYNDFKSIKELVIESFFHFCDIITCVNYFHTLASCRFCHG